MQYDRNLSPFNLVAYPHRLHPGIGNNLSSSNNDKVSKGRVHGKTDGKNPVTWIYTLTTKRKHNLEEIKV